MEEIGGYLSAVLSGQTTCRRLASATAALGLAFGKGKSGIPTENKADRRRQFSGFYGNFFNIQKRKQYDRHKHKTGS